MAMLSRNPSSLVALIALLSASACHKADAVAPAPKASAARAGAASGEPAGAIPDPTISVAVATELHKDKGNESGVKVVVTDGIVQLTGKVDNVLSKDRSTRVAEAVRGVRSVSNRLMVAPVARPDQDIQRDVKKALLYNAATAKMPIHTTVKGGVVTLTGTVASWQEQQLAERIADGVRGVLMTENTLSRASKPKRVDNAIADDVKSRLAWDVLVEHDPVAVAVKDSNVTLSGSVGSAAENRGPSAMLGSTVWARSTRARCK